MHVNVAKEVAALRAMSVSELRATYSQVFGEETRVGNKTWLIKRIIWRLQALAEGDLSERARRRAAELAQDADLRLSPPRPPQGQLVRIPEILEPSKNLPESEQSLPELPGFQGEPEY